MKSLEKTNALLKAHEEKIAQLAKEKTALISEKASFEKENKDLHNKLAYAEKEKQDDMKKLEENSAKLWDLKQIVEKTTRLQQVSLKKAEQTEKKYQDAKAELEALKVQLQEANDQADGYQATATAEKRKREESENDLQACEAKYVP